jgi:hypothetical protein
MEKPMKSLLLSLLFVITSIIPVVAEGATLAWDQNPEPEVVGYKIYYKTNTTTFPFNGSSLPEGASPITVNGANNTSLTVDLPDDGNIYYFTATAVSSSGLESTFSDIIASEWVPHLITPTNNVAVNTDVRFAWNPHPSGENFTFDLYFGTDPNFDTSTASFTTPGTFSSNWPRFEPHSSLMLVVLLSMLMVMINPDRVKRLWRPFRFGLCIGVFVIQASCGGGSGDDFVTSTGTTVMDPGTTVMDPGTTVTDPGTNPTPALSTTVVTDINATEYQATLQANTQYYWKIVAQDNWGNIYESIPQKFTTLSN